MKASLSMRRIDGSLVATAVGETITSETGHG
jgi:hypothetical protein